MKRIFLWIGGSVGIVALLVAGFFVFVFEWNMLRGPLAGWMSRHADREVEIAGDFRGQWSLTPLVQIRNFRIANADWAEEPAMVDVEALDLRLDLRALLRGEVVIPEMRVQGAQILLEIDEQGRQNWELGDAAPDEREDVPAIEALVIENSTLRFRDRTRGIEIDGRVQSAEVVSPDEGTLPVTLEGTGTVEGQGFTLLVRGGPLQTLQEPERPYPVQANIRIGPTAANVEGTLGGARRVAELDVVLQVEGPDPALLAPVLQIPLPSTPPYRLSGRLLSRDDIWRFDGFQGVVGESDLSGSLVLDFSRERPFIEANLVSDQTRFQDLGPLVGVRPGRGTGEGGAPARVLPDAPLQLEQVSGVDAHVTYRAGRVVAETVPVTEVGLELELQNGVLRLSPLRFGAAGGDLIVFTTIDTTRTPVHTAYDIHLSTARLQAIFDRLQVEGAAEGFLHARARFETLGDSIRSALGTASGTAAVLVGRGRIAGSPLALLDASLLEALAVTVTDGQPAPMDVRCLVAGFNIADGAMRTTVMVLDTEDSLISADGTVDLGEETLAFRIVSEPKEPGLGGGRTPINLTGRFNDVSVDIDATEAVARGAVAAALGVLATPLAALLGLFEPGLADDVDCRGLVDYARQHVQ